MGREVRTRSLYDQDFYSWAHRQSELLRAGRLGELDVENIAEKIESLGRSEASSLQSSFRLIIVHLLNMQHQPDKLTDSWRNTIARERLNAEQIIDDNPGLKPRMQELFLKAHAQARKLAAHETMLPVSFFPTAPEFGLDQVRDEHFFPATVNVFDPGD